MLDRRYAATARTRINPQLIFIHIPPAPVYADICSIIADHFANISIISSSSDPKPYPGVWYESFATVGEIRVWWRADFQSGSSVLKKVF